MNTSYCSDQVIVGSGWNIGLQQRLLDRFYFSASCGHLESEYEVGTTGIPPPPPTDPTASCDATPILITQPGRKESVERFNARLTIQFLERLSFAATYQDAKNLSSRPGYSFSSKPYGFEISCRY